MSSYIKNGKAIEYDNAPDWLVAFMRYDRAIEGKSVNTDKTYFLDLRGFFQWVQMFKETGSQPKSAEELRDISILALPLSAAVSVTKSDVETYLHFLADVLENGPATRNKKLASVKAFYYYVVDHQEELGVELQGNPAARIKKVKQPKKNPIYLDQSEQQQMLMVDNQNSIRDEAIILFLNVTGVRISELVNLDLDDISLKRKRARIRNGKGAKERTVVLTDNLCNALADYLQLYRNTIPDLTTNALFVSTRQKERLTTRAIQMMIKQQGMKNGVFGVTPHKYRHTVATMLAQQGEDVLTIQGALGHESPSTTAIYTHLGEEDIAYAVNRSYVGNLSIPCSPNKLEKEEKL